MAWLASVKPDYIARQRALRLKESIRVENQAGADKIVQKARSLPNVGFIEVSPV